MAEVLVDKGYRHVSTGELLREQIRLGTKLGLEAKTLMDQGQFVPDDVVVGMIRDLIESVDSGSMFLFDGFPRTLVQAEKLDELISDLCGTLKNVFLLECPDDVIVSRLSGRRTCSKCGAVYHTAFNPPSDDDGCDQDGCELVQRADDSEATIRKRLLVYAEQTAPLIDYYTNKGLVDTVDATQSIETVRNAVLEYIA
ncbi:MAG: nucleoside monophosphate kinase [Pontiellaceae bacterium]|nr:nucleoside monophosphate kinase [Pontiellaceae bacterium]MBN2784757.1 nucleoside monophosphate kinase [Pontiellaceae bacterium]